MLTYVINRIMFGFFPSRNINSVLCTLCLYIYIYILSTSYCYCLYTLVFIRLLCAGAAVAAFYVLCINDGVLPRELCIAAYIYKEYNNIVIMHRLWNSSRQHDALPPTHSCGNDVTLTTLSNKKLAQQSIYKFSPFTNLWCIFISKNCNTAVNCAWKYSTIFARFSRKRLSPLLRGCSYIT